MPQDIESQSWLYWETLTSSWKVTLMVTNRQASSLANGSRHLCLKRSVMKSWQSGLTGEGADVKPSCNWNLDMLQVSFHFHLHFHFCFLSKNCHMSLYWHHLLKTSEAFRIHILWWECWPSWNWLLWCSSFHLPFYLCFLSLIWYFIYATTI